MDTNELIRNLAADAGRPAASVSSVWWAAMAIAAVITGATFAAALGPRPDLAAAAETPRFLFKFVVTISLAASAFGVARALSRPGEAWRNVMPFLATAPFLLAAAVLMELLVLPPDAWATSLVGTNGIVCLTSILLIGIGPLAVFLFALRHSAPTRPALAGAVAGLLAGGIAAAFYASHCTDDSPLFVATWYMMAIAALASIGAVAANRFARW